MPFTLAHPAAAVPLRRALGRKAVFSALVIGSMVPDFWYFAPFALTRADTHSVAGLFWFCVPAGVLVYLAYHAIVKVPLFELLPEGLARRLAAGPAGAPGFPRAPAFIVVANLFLGALTHLAWDALTHEGVVVDRVPLLRAPLFSIGAYEAYGYSVLQHASTVAALALLAWWIWRWWRLAPLAPAAARGLPRAIAIAMLGAVTFTVAGIGFSALAAAWGQRTSLAETRHLAKAAFGQAGGAVLLSLLAYGIAWHATRYSFTRRSRRALLTTDTELIAMAAPAKMGESSRPKKG